MSWSSLVEKSLSFSGLASLLKPVIFPLNDSCIVEISGEGAEKLLQGQITCDVSKLNSESGSFGAICTPQGRMYALFKIAKKEDCYLLSMPRVIANEFISRLNKYRQFFKAEVRIKEEWVVFGMVIYEAPQALIKGYNLPEKANGVSIGDHSINFRLPTMDPCWEIWIEKNSWLTEESGPHPDTEPTIGHPNDWFIKLITNGIPELTINTIDKFIPQNINVHKLGGINFKKGCYTGQEIVARMQYLGKQKKALYTYHTIDEQDISPGSTLFDQAGKSVGTVINNGNHRDENRGLAILPLDSESESSTEYFIGDQKHSINLQLSVPMYQEIVDGPAK